jgi:PAS domain S-box-containing protein
MPTELRQTGISVVGDIPWGTHFCHFYETKQDLLDTLVPYFKAGLDSKEFCVWVVSDSELISVEEAKRALKQAVPDLDRHLSDENIQIFSGLDWYLEEGVFSLERVTSAWDARLKQALARGYDGMRVSGDTLWLAEKDWKDFFAYEKQLNESITDQPMTVLCTYPLAKSGATEVLDVVQAHQFAIARREGEWEVIETPELIHAQAEIERLNEELEQRVVERTRELAAANEQLRKEMAERQQAEDALRGSEDRLRLVIDTVPALIHTGLPDGQLDFFNQRWLDFVGLSLEHLSGWKWTAVIHPEDVAAMVERWRAALATGEPYEHAARVRRADGEYRWMVHREVPLRDERGNIVKWYASSIEIEDRKRAEDALRQSEERFAAFMDNLPGYAWMKNLQGRYVYVNEMVRGLPGYRSLGKTDAQIWPADLAAEYRANDQQVIAAKKPLHTLEHFHLEGKHRYMAGSKFPIFDKTGAVALVGGVGVDITERVEAEEAVRRSEEHLRLVIDTIPTMAWSVRPDGVVDFLNQPWMDYAGLSLEEYVKDPTGPIHPEDIPRVIEKWLAQKAVGEGYEDEMRLRRADGEYRWFLVRTAPLRDEQGNLVKWYGVSIDIEDRKRAEEALKESQRRLEEAQRIAHVGHWDRDLETGLITWSDEIYRILGLPVQEGDSPRREWLDIVHPEDRPRLSLAIEELERGIQRLDVEFRIVRPNGEVRFLHSQGDVIHDERGRPLHRFGTAQDITERRSVEDELKKEKEILEKIFENIPVMIGFVGEDGQVKLVNLEWERTIGWTLKELQEQNVDIFAEAYPDLSYRQEVLDFVAAATGEWVDLKIRVRDGRVIDAACAVVRLSDGTRVAIAQDITERKQAEDALRRSEDRIRLIIDTIPVMAWSIQPDGGVDFVNQRWMDYTGISLEEESEEPTRPIHPEDVPRVMERWLVEKQVGEPYDEEMRLRRADGEYRWFLVRTAPLRDEHGSIVKWYGVSIEIEDRKRAEMQSRALIDAIPQQIWSGPPDGSNDYVNDRWRSETGLGLEEMRGDGWQTLLHPDDRERVLKAWQYSVQTGTLYEQEERHRTADGTYRWYLNRGVPLRDDEGRIIRWYGTNTDIEDRKQAEDKLRHSEVQLAQAQRLAHVGSWDWDLRTSKVTWSDELYRVFGLEPGTTMVAGDAMSFIHPHDQDLVWSTVKNAVANKERYSFYYRALRPDGTERIVHSRGEVLTDDHGEPIRVFGATQDVTELKRAEEKLKATTEQLRALSASLQSAREEEATRIAREIHDELGGALTSLKWDLESFDRVISELREQSQLEVLRDKIEGMLRLSETTISAVRRISSELRPSVLDDLGLASAIEWQAQQFQARTGIICHCELSVTNVDLDREQSTAIFRILQEALTNILRHAQATRVEIAIKEESGEIVLTVSDNGRGITADEKSSLQSLGLLGMRERAHLIGGAIEIIGVDAQGTVVTVRVPNTKRR